VPEIRDQWILVYDIEGPHSSVVDDSSLLGCFAVSADKYLTEFLRNYTPLKAR
jgi:hypothetical protein